MLFFPLSLFSQSQDFRIDGTTLVRYRGSAENVTIPEGVTTIGKGAFWGCTNITNITIPTNITSIAERAFEGCSGLTSVTIPDSVASIGEYAFTLCRNLKTVTVSRKTKIGAAAFPTNTRITYSD